jgi:hypothetical protein
VCQTTKALDSMRHDDPGSNNLKYVRPYLRLKWVTYPPLLRNPINSADDEENFLRENCRVSHQ